MREEIKDEEVSTVAGGRVAIDTATNTVSFTTYGKCYTLKNGHTAKQARNFVNNLLDENEGLGEKEFDLLAAKALRANGYI